jgi:cyclopropane-fatty-acyl-phospholipid synthase
MSAAAAHAGAAPADIRAHYDAGNAFFALFLDETLSYSCALFAAGVEDLAAAQRAKMDWHLDRAHVGRDTRLLDIGCGWGGLLERAVWERGAVRAVGLTLSEAQAAHIRTVAAPRIEARLEHWADHAPTGPYDAIVSVGAFEHFAEPGLNAAGRIAAYRTFFSRAAALLRPGGRLSLQTIAYPEAFDRAAYDASDYGAFVRARIFPGSDLPTLREVLTACDPVFEPEIVRNDRRDYARTTRHWLAALRARRAEGEALAGAERVRDLERYFRISIGAFETGNLQLLRLGLRRRVRGVGV